MTKGMPCWWKTSISALHTEEWYSPATPTTLSLVISFSTTVAPVGGTALGILHDQLDLLAEPRRRRR